MPERWKDIKQNAQQESAFAHEEGQEKPSPVEMFVNSIRRITHALLHRKDISQGTTKVDSNIGGIFDHEEDNHDKL